MTFQFGEVPFGLRDIKLTPINPNGSYGTPVDLPAAQTMSFTLNQDEKELRGDDAQVATAAQIKGISWSLDAGGLNLDALAVILGVSPVSSASTPNRTKILTSANTDIRPSFRVDGRAIGTEQGGDLKCILYKCRCTGKIGPFEMKDGDFLITKLEGTGIDDSVHGIFAILQEETASENSL